MKLNFPSTLTREKMLTIFLLTFLQSNGVKAGLGSKKCFIDNGYSGYYDALLRFPFVNNSEVNNNQILSLCCNNSTFSCLLTAPNFCAFPNRRFLCNKIAQSITCVGGGCRSIIGDKLISDDTISDSCDVSFEMMENYFAFSFDSGAFYVDKNNQYSSGVCPTHSTCSNLVEHMTCGGDNGGGTCCDYGFYLSDAVNNFGNNSYVDNSNKCYLQGNSPFPSKKNIPSKSFLNQSGLSTPGPISIISAIISIAGIFSFEVEKYSVGWFSKLLLFCNIIRSSSSLVGSWNSLIGGGIREFEYPSTALLTSFTLSFSIFSIEKSVERLEGIKTVREELPMQNLWQEEIEEIDEENEEIDIYQALRKLKKVYSLRYLCGSIIGISFIGELLSVIVYGLQKNLPSSARFVTDCISVPVDATGISYFECNENIRCFIKDGNSNFQDLLTRSYSLFLATSSMIMLGLIKKNRFDGFDGFNWPFRRWFGRRNNQIRNTIRYNFYSLAALFVAGQAIGSIAYQTNITIDINGLEGCDINGSELGSKTGYLQEGLKQEGTPVDKVISGISRKIALS